ncbi:MAG TPA: hypothetical protein VGW12_17390 [Pyrinomonadaceae bacterium]|nr:hypothetical protein [Pyrinomonadaceae bacterium]
MLLDDFLPAYDVSERHLIEVHASKEEVYAAVRQLDLRRAKLSMLLFRLRGMPTGRVAPACFTLNDFLRMRFILLGERVNEELLLGLVGRFWSPSGELRRLDAEGFRNFNEPGYAKAAWNFSLSERTDKTVLLATETRVHCLDKTSRRRFRLYWFFIGAFSGLIRREVLQAIKQNAETAHAASSILDQAALAFGAADGAGEDPEGEGHQRDEKE